MYIGAWTSIVEDCSVKQGLVTWSHTIILCRSTLVKFSQLYISTAEMISKSHKIVKTKWTLILNQVKFLLLAFQFSTLCLHYYNLRIPSAAVFVFAAHWRWAFDTLYSTRLSRCCACSHCSFWIRLVSSLSPSSMTPPLLDDASLDPSLFSLEKVRYQAH